MMDGRAIAFVEGCWAVTKSAQAWKPVTIAALDSLPIPGHLSRTTK